MQCTATQLESWRFDPQAWSLHVLPVSNRYLMELGNSKLVVGVILSFFFILFIFLHSTKDRLRKTGGAWVGEWQYKTNWNDKEKNRSNDLQCSHAQARGKSQEHWIIENRAKTENEENAPTGRLRGKIYDDDEMSRYYLKQRNINKRENDEKHARKRNVGNMHEWVLLCVCVCARLQWAVCVEGEKSREIRLPSSGAETLRCLQTAEKPCVFKFTVWIWKL